MTGWKSKAGAIIMALGAAFLGCFQVMDEQSASEFIRNARPWFRLIGTFLSLGGGSLLGIGISHKVQKSGEAAPSNKS